MPITEAIPAQLPLILRPATAEDHPYIVDSWLLSFRGQAIGRDAGPAYVRDMKWFIRRLLSTARVLVAADADHPATIWGWTATADKTVLYVYVREQFRRNGVAKILLGPFLTRPDIVYCARTHHDVPIPSGWRYSFLHAIRVATEAT